MVNVQSAKKIVKLLIFVVTAAQKLTLSVSNVG